MMERYNRLPPEEQRIVVVTLLGAAASLWLAVAWEELMVLAAIPLLFGIGVGADQGGAPPGRAPQGRGALLR